MTRVRGNPFHPLNKGKLCAKGQAAVQWVYNPQRIEYPLARVGGRGENKFRRIDWDEALESIATRLMSIKAEGPETIMLAKGQSSSWGGLHHLLWIRFLCALGSPNFTWWGPYICWGPQLMYHSLTIGGPSYTKPDYHKSDLILEWFTGGGTGGPARGGVETHDTNLRSVPLQIVERLKQGAKLVVINPQLIPLAANGRAYKWLPIRPGTDSALALSMIHIIIHEKLYDHEFVSTWCEGFEELKSFIKEYTPQWAQKITDIPLGEIIELARLYATTKRACIRVSEAPQKRDLHSFGMAVPILMAITGHLDRPGGNVWMDSAAHLGFDTFRARLSEKVKGKLLDGENFYISSRGKTVTHFPSVIEALLTGRPYRPRAMMIFGSNPLSTARNPVLIDQALRRLELLVVVDVTMTPTARLADFVLPAATRYECEGQPAIWQNHLATSSKVIEPLGESRNEIEIILDLACRLGMKEDFWNGEYKQMMNDYLRPTNISYEQLIENRLKGIYLPRTEWMDRRERFETLFEKLPGGKIQLYSKVFAEKGFDPLPTYLGEAEDPQIDREGAEAYPLMFTDEHSHYMNQHAWMRNIPWLREIQKHPVVRINPETAKKWSISDGDWVDIVSRHGRAKAVAVLVPTIRPNLLMGQHGWWQGCEALGLGETSPLEGGANPNLLYDWGQKDSITGDITKNTLVRIEKGLPPENEKAIQEVE